MSKYRHEYKYIINKKEENILLIRAQGLLSRDVHVNEDGSYIITSLYFDDYDNSCFAENESGTDPRSKFRIRYYNDNSEYLKLEKKTKKRGMTLKESCKITKEECIRIINGDIPRETEGRSQMAVKLFTEMRLRNMIPKVIVSYERIPYIYPAGNVRVTFDRSIYSSNDISGFLEGDFMKRPILPIGKSIMEIKWDELLPLHIKENLHIDSLQWSTFSKYALCRKYNLNGEIK